MATAPAKQVQSVNGLLRPIHRRIVELIDRGIALGAVAPGYRLPPERELAPALRVSRATIVAAYRELESRGLVRVTAFRARL